MSLKVIIYMLNFVKVIKTFTCDSLKNVLGENAQMFVDSEANATEYLLVRRNTFNGLI